MAQYNGKKLKSADGHLKIVQTAYGGAIPNDLISACAPQDACKGSSRNNTSPHAFAIMPIVHMPSCGNHQRRVMKYLMPPVMSTIERALEHPTSMADIPCRICRVCETRPSQLLHVTTWGREKHIPTSWVPFNIFPKPIYDRVATLQQGGNWAWARKPSAGKGRREE